MKASLLLFPIFSGTATTAQSQTCLAADVEVFVGSAATAQGQTCAGTGAEAFAATAGTAQSQTVAATGAETFSASASTSQAQTILAADIEVFVASAATSQSQSAAAAGQEVFSAAASTAQAQTILAADTEVFVASGATAQSQSVAGAGTVITVAATVGACYGQGAAFGYSAFTQAHVQGGGGHLLIRREVYRRKAPELARTVGSARGHSRAAAASAVIRAVPDWNLLVPAPLDPGAALRARQLREEEEILLLV